jgi:hypothetical protein
MTGFLLLTLAFTCAFLIVQGLVRRGGIYQYPFLAGAVFAGFLLPQFVGLSRDRFLPSGALDATLVLAILSASMCWLGAVVVRRPMRAGNWELSEKRLLVASAVLSLLGAYFYFALSRLPPEMLSVSQWSGLPVAYLFFARMLTYGFALGVLLYARNGSYLALAVALFGATFCMDRILIGGRRQDLVETLTIILLAFWFQRGWCLPRSVMLAGLVAGALFINSIGDYRAATLTRDGPQWSSVAEIDFVGNFERLMENGGAEVRNAVFTVAAVGRSMKFDLGIAHWNLLVFSYVPAQIVGRDLKNALYLPVATPLYEEYFYTPAMGSTLTGLSDAFQSFWFFGCLKFFVIGFIMQKLWLAAGQGSLTAQLLYMLMPVYAMQAITHTTHYFVSPWVHLGIFLFPALLVARQPMRRRKDSDIPAAAGNIAMPGRL